MDKYRDKVISMYTTGQKPSENQKERQLSIPDLTKLTAYINANHSGQIGNIPTLTNILNTKTLIDNPIPIGKVTRPTATKKEFIILLKSKGIPVSKIEGILSKKVIEALGDSISFSGSLEDDIFKYLKTEGVISTEEAGYIAELKNVDDPGYQVKIPDKSLAENELGDNVVLEQFDVKAALAGSY